MNERAKSLDRSQQSRGEEEAAAAQLMYGPFTCEVHKNWDFLTTIPLTQPISTVVSTDEPTPLLPLSAEVICERPLREMKSEGEGGGDQVAQIAKWRGRMAQKRTGRKRGREGGKKRA